MISNSVAVPFLKDYVLTEKLGQGTYGTVYKAYRKIGSRQVIAVKCVAKASLNRVATENLLTEIELLKTLRHENIVELIDFMWDSNYIYLMMEYCSGGDLSKFIKTHRILSEARARRLLQQLASALQYMRQKNVSHMDLKPHNIFLSSPENMVLKVGDFGFAQYLIGETDAPFLRGSLLYMAPEIIINRHYNEKADLWSTGVILYECVFGMAPFACRDMYDLREKVLDTKPIEIPFQPVISSHCRDLITRLLKRNPAERITFNEFFTHPFLDFEHRPCSEALGKAIEIVKEAVQHDESKNYSEAIQLYSKALSYFIPAILYESDSKKKMALRDRVAQYMHRAEELKHRLREDVVMDNSISAQQPQSSYLQYKELVVLCKVDPILESALTIIESAKMRESSEDFAGALEKYTLALETLIKLLPDQPLGRRKDLMQQLISKWMTQAETIKRYLAVKDLEIKEATKEEEEEDKSYLSQCMLQ